MCTLEDPGLFPCISFSVSPSFPSPHSPSTCFCAPLEKKEYKESGLGQHEANQLENPTLERIKCCSVKISNAGFCCKRSYVTTMGSQTWYSHCICKSSLLSFQHPLHPHPLTKKKKRKKKKQKREQKFPGLYQWPHLFWTQQSPQFHVECGKELLIAFPLINNQMCNKKHCTSSQITGKAQPTERFEMARASHSVRSSQWFTSLISSSGPVSTQAPVSLPRPQSEQLKRGS